MGFGLDPDKSDLSLEDPTVVTGTQAAPPCHLGRSLYRIQPCIEIGPQTNPRAAARLFAQGGR